MTNADERLAVAIERVGKILGALYASHLGDLEQGVKAERLSRCGFSNAEIADLLGTSPNTINVALHHARRKKKGKKRRPQK
jgi:IS30 family transposase